MNHYAISDLRVGITESFRVTVTKEMQELFMKMSGDANPMHTDASYAVRGGYKGCLVYGMCTASLYSTLAGVYLPGEKCLLQSCEVAWPRPVYVGDELTVTGKVAEVDERLGRIRIKASIRNQNGECVSRARITAGVRGE